MNLTYISLIEYLFFRLFQDSWEDEEEKKDEEKVEVKPIKTKSKKSLTEIIAEKEVIKYKNN